MHFYFGGAEIPSHRKVLAEVGAKDAALSFMGLRRRVKFAQPWTLAEKFPEHMGILLDSGAYTVNSDDEDKYSIADLKAISDQYQQFVMENIDRVDMVTEFDAMPLGREWIEAQREDFYEDLAAEKFMVIWHPEWGEQYLRDLAAKYRNVGVPATALGGRNLVPLLNSLVRDHGTKLHGVGVTQVDEMSYVKWHSVSSTSWISPQRYGDTIVWDGRELKRYPKRYKEKARKLYRGLFEKEGFDAEKIEADDSTELLRLSVWSWEMLVADIEKRHSRRGAVTTEPGVGTPGFAEDVAPVVDINTGEVRNPVSTDVEPYEGPESGLEPVRATLAPLAGKLSPGEFTSLQDGLIELQAQRVIKMRQVELSEGQGYADPNLSAEMDRLQKYLKSKHDMSTSSLSIKVEARGGAVPGGGIVGRLFGEQASQRVQSETVVEGEVYDADVIEPDE